MSQTSSSSTVTIGGTVYDFADLSDRAKAEFAGVRETDRRIAEAENTIRLLRTARNAYVRALKANLPADGNA